MRSHRVSLVRKFCCLFSLLHPPFFWNLRFPSHTFFHLRICTHLSIRIHHGGSDRVTSPTGSQAFFERVSSQDKSIKIWPGYEHVMMKNVNGMSEEDQQKRMAVLDGRFRLLIGTRPSPGMFG